MTRSICTLLLGLLCGSASAATFVVNSSQDLADANPGDSACDAAGAVQCTFRAALMEANARAGFDTIEFSLGAATLFPLTPYPIIFDDVFIDGASSPAYTVGAGPLQSTPAIYLDGNGVSAAATPTSPATRSSRTAPTAPGCAATTPTSMPTAWA